MGTFSAFVRSEVLTLAERLRAGVDPPDVDVWKHTWAYLLDLRPEPSDGYSGPEEIIVRSWDGEVRLLPDEVPRPKDVDVAIREYVRARRLYVVALEEEKASGRFRSWGQEEELRDVVLKSEAWDFFVNGVVNNLTPPDLFAFMDGGFDVTTNWIEREGLEVMLEDEAAEGLLAKLQETSFTSLARDYARTLEVFERALQGGHELFFFEAGT